MVRVKTLLALYGTGPKADLECIEFATWQMESVNVHLDNRYPIIYDNEFLR